MVNRLLINTSVFTSSFRVSELLSSLLTKVKVYRNMIAISVVSSWSLFLVISSWQLTIASRRQNHFIRKETRERHWYPLIYPDDNKLCLHALPVEPKYPLPLNASFNATEEREVLLEIFLNTGGSHWYNNSGWNTSMPHCQWYGITCNISSGQIIVLSLQSNNLAGTLPASLWKLRNLQGLCFGANPGIFGNLADFLSPNMTRLMRIDLASNSLYGNIPDEIMPGLKSLVKLQLSGNQLGGAIPHSIDKLSELGVLSIGENLIHGKVPETIGKLSKLWFLDLESLTNLDSTMELFLNLTSLRFIHLSASGLHGTLPDDFGLIFPGLLECLLSENSLNGSIPSTIGNIAGLLHLSLAKNHFSGLVPKSLGQIRDLEVLDISTNDLTGFEDSFVFNTTKLSSLSLSNNLGFKMDLSSLLSMLQPAKQSLSSLNASHCNFAGSISDTIWSFTNIIFLDVQRNSLTGPLPSPIDNMLFLTLLDFSVNNLTGDIPETYAKILALQNFDVSSNPRLKHGKGVVGKIPRFCRPDPTLLVRENKEDRFTCPIIRFKYNDGIIKMDSSYYDQIYCICDKGFYGKNGKCLQCMSGGHCTQTNDSKFPSYMEIAKGHWPSPVPYNVTHLVSCQTTRRQSFVCSPSGHCKCSVNDTSNEGHYLTTCDPRCICREGSTGRFCSECKNNFYSHGNLCLACPSGKLDKLVVLIPVILVAVLAFIFTAWLALFKRYRKRSLLVVIIEILFVTVLHVLNFIPSWLFEINILFWLLGIAGHGHKARGILKISIFYFQFLDAMVSNFQLWPSSVIKVQRYFSNIFNFQFEGLECYFPNLFTPVGKLVSILSLPACVIVATGILFVFYALLCRVLNARPEKVKNAWYFSLNMVIVLLNFLYFPIVKRSLSALSPCLDDMGLSYLPENPWIDCPSPEYKVMRILGYCSLVIYVIGVPFAVFLPLLIWFLLYKKEVREDGANVADTWLGSLYLPYDENYRTFVEVFYLCRRAIFASLLAFISSQSVYQTPLISFAILVSLLLHMLYKPYLCSRELLGINVENSQECLNLSVLLLSFVFLGSSALRNSSDILMWLVIAMNCITTALCVIVALIRLAAKEEHHILVNQVGLVDNEGENN